MPERPAAVQQSRRPAGPPGPDRWRGLVVVPWDAVADLGVGLAAELGAAGVVVATLLVLVVALVERALRVASAGPPPG